MTINLENDKTSFSISRQSALSEKVSFVLEERILGGTIDISISKQGLGKWFEQQTWHDGRNSIPRSFGDELTMKSFGQTVTTQMSLCCRCAIIVEDLPSHRTLFCENGFLTTNSKNLTNAFQYFVDSADRIDDMQSESFKFAKNNLNYVNLARRIYV